MPTFPTSLCCCPESSANRKKLQPEETIADMVSNNIKGFFPFTMSLIHVKNMILGPSTNKIEFVLMNFTLCVCVCRGLLLHLLRSTGFKKTAQSGVGMSLSPFYRYKNKFKESKCATMNKLQTPKSS